MIEWLQKWYTSKCDGDWENLNGISINTLDNPGWSVSIDLTATELSSKPFKGINRDISDTDWIVCRVGNGKFEGYGDTSKLLEILSVFKNWSEE